MKEANEVHYNGQEIAVVGLSIRVVKAKNIEEFWDNLRNGVESVLQFTDEELLEAGENPDRIEQPNYVKAGSILEDKYYFDAPFFGYTPREAELLDPQVRLFHECSWEALEDAGIDPESYPGLIGVYAGAVQTPEWEAMAMFSGKSAAFGSFAASKLTGIRYLCTRLSYNMNLRGPSITIQTACSTGLVAIHMACQALLSGECDVAIAGGISAAPKKKSGYLYEEGMIDSPDGHTRTFDADAKGTLFGQGGGVVVLKPLDDARDSNDHIYAIIKSTTVNNDGNRKVGFTAPSVEAQVFMMRAAYHLADINPETLAYVEAHGTATPLGDPIEFEALRQAFNTKKREWCGIGSVKTNLGHLDAAAGIAGFIKAVLILKHQEIPPSLFYNTPNPSINIVDSPFVVNTTLKSMERMDYPLRVAVNSLGMGGTNAHIVLEEAPKREESSVTDQCQLLVFSANSKNSLDKMTKNLARFLERNKQANLADVCYTLQTRRKKFKYRRSLVCQHTDEAIAVLTEAEQGKIREYHSLNDEKKIIFMFPGQGSQYINMGLDLYRTLEFLRREMDEGFAIVKPLLGFDLKEIIYPANHFVEKAKEKINDVLITPAAVFIFEYALAKLLMFWGIKPDVMIGHSFGEYTAACLAGVFSFADALKIIVFRNKLMSELPSGSMTSIPIPAQQLEPLLNDQLSLAIDNGPSCIVAGSEEAVVAFESEMKAKKCISQRVQISVACHSQVMNSVLDLFESKLREVTLSPCKIPFISNVTGTWITDQQATNPRYWAEHLRETVKFADGIKELLKQENPLFLEVGPGNILSRIAFQLFDKKSQINSIYLVRNPDQDVADVPFLLDKVGRLWLYNVPIDWPSYYANQKRQSITLLPYAFEHERYWLPEVALENFVYDNRKNKKPNFRDWFYTCSWVPESQLKLKKVQSNSISPYNWLLFLDDVQIGKRMCETLAQDGHRMITVTTGDTFAELGADRYILNPGNSDDYSHLWKRLNQTGGIPRKIIHLWGVTGSGTDNINLPSLEDGQNKGFYSLLFLAQALETQNSRDEFEIVVITDHMQQVTADEIISPVKATVLGPVFVIPQEYENINCRSIDISLFKPNDGQLEHLIQQLVTDVLDPFPEKITAYRQYQKWKPSYEPVEFFNDSSRWALRENGVYLITGGIGGVGFALAQELASTCKIQLVLVGRSRLPVRAEWDNWLSSHEKQDPISKKIKKIQVLEKTANHVFYFDAEVSDFEMMKKGIAGAEEIVGPINGIIHAAGGTAGESIAFIRNQQRDKCEQQFRAKVSGLLALDQIFNGRELDFVLLTSSMTSFLGGWEYVAYTAANFFMDRFALRSQRWITINLDPINLYGDKNPDTTLTINELFQTLKYVLANIEKGQVLVSLGNLQQRIEKASKALKSHDVEDSKSKIDSGEKKNTAFFPRPNLTTPYYPPTDEFEAGLVEICREIFGYDKIGIMDDFFELGANSLTIIRFISEIQGKFHVKLHVRDMFDKTKICHLAKMIKEAGKETYLSIEQVEKKEYYPLSSAQKRLYVIQQIESQFTGYNIPWPLELLGNIDKKRFLEAFLKIIDRHESFRTSFHQIDGAPVQQIQEYASFEMIYKDAANALEVNEIIKSFIRPFDLACAPLMRAALINLAENHHVLVIDIHHIICDWHSMSMFTRDFLAFYMGQQLPLLKLQYKDYSQWQNQGKHREIIEKQEEYWLQRFAGKIPVLDLPTDYQRSAVHDFEGMRIGFEIEDFLMDEIGKILLETGTTSFMLVLAVYTILLSIYTGQDAIVVGVPTVGRNHKDLENIIGMFVNMLPMKNSLRPNQSFRQFLMEVKENFIQDFENQDYSFDDLVSKLNLPRQSNRTPLVETMLTKLDALSNQDNGAVNQNVGLQSRGWVFEHFPAKFELALDVLDFDGSMKMWLTYSTRLFKPSTIEKIKEHYLEIFEQVVKNLDIKLEEIQISSGLEAASPIILQDESGDFGF